MEREKKSCHYIVKMSNLDAPSFHQTCWRRWGGWPVFFFSDLWEVKVTCRLFAGVSLLANLSGMQGMPCFALVTCPQVYHVSSGAFAWHHALWHSEGPTGLTGMSPFTKDTNGVIPPKRAEWVHKVAPFSTICHYLKWHVIVLRSEIHYASTESKG